MSSSPDPPSYVRLGTLGGFLPLNDITTITTRGQKLSGLIQQRSSNNINSLKKRQQIRLGGESDEEDQDGERNQDEVDSRSKGLSPAKNSRYATSERRGSGVSDIEQVLNTPQMRSMRLIGNSNPRYQW